MIWSKFHASWTRFALAARFVIGSNGTKWYKSLCVSLFYIFKWTSNAISWDKQSDEPNSDVKQSQIQSSSVKTPSISGNQSTFWTLHFKSLFSNWEQFASALWAGGVREWNELLSLASQPFFLFFFLFLNLFCSYYTAGVTRRIWPCLWELSSGGVIPNPAWFLKATGFMALLSNTWPKIQSRLK